MIIIVPILQTIDNLKATHVNLEIVFFCEADYVSTLYFASYLFSEQQQYLSLFCFGSGQRLDIYIFCSIKSSLNTFV